MPTVLIVILLLVLSLFALSSTSQSYASAKQAQAAIEASRAVQIAGAGNLVATVTVALVVVAVLVAVVVLAWLVLHAKSQPKRHWTRTGNGGWDQFQQPDANALIPALMTLLLYEMTQHQQNQDIEQFCMDQPALNDTLNDTPVFPDNTWDM